MHDEGSRGRSLKTLAKLDLPGDVGKQRLSVGDVAEAHGFVESRQQLSQDAIADDARERHELRLALCFRQLRLQCLLLGFEAADT
jgi:hypothetical protein